MKRENLMTQRTDHCGCSKPDGWYGKGGFHLCPNPEQPNRPPADIVMERCPAYLSATERAISGGAS